MKREHEPMTLDNGVTRCKHCGSAWSANMGISCVDRPDGNEQRIRARPPSFDSADDIFARLDELRRGRDAVAATTAPDLVPLADGLDGC